MIPLNAPVETWKGRKLKPPTLATNVLKDRKPNRKSDNDENEVESIPKKQGYALTLLLVLQTGNP